MKKNKTRGRDQQSGSMLSQKTNEDHNKQQPDPNNPNQLSKKVGNDKVLKTRKKI